jgi:hypothetical protein
MSKLPLETRPLRLSPEVQKVVESKLAPLNGKDLKAAQDAVLGVYRSGHQMASEQWVNTYTSAIDTAIEK